MRTVSAGLELAQGASGRIPSISLVFHIAGGSTIDYSDRMLEIEHHEEAWNGYALIVLQNEDRVVQQLQGSWIEIEYGDVLSATTEREARPRLWVMTQQQTSTEGVLSVELTLIDTFAMLTLLKILEGEPPYYKYEPYPGNTVQEIIDAVLVAGGFNATTIVSNDGIVSAYEPKFWINESRIETSEDIIERLFGMTKSYPRLQPGLDMEIVYPEETDTPDETYYSYQAPFFFAFFEKRNILIPNRIIVYGDYDYDTGLWPLQRDPPEVLVSGEVNDTTAQAQFNNTTNGIITNIVWAPDAEDNTDCEIRAASALTKTKSELLAGKLLIQHDCRVEMYDKVAVIDLRGRE